MLDDWNPEIRKPPAISFTPVGTPPASQSDEALINVGPINRIPGTDSISCPGLPSGMMCFGWGEQGWAINDKDGKRVAAGNWGDRATLPASQSEALVDLIAHELAEWLEWKDAMEAATAMLRIAKLERAEGKREGIEEAAKVCLEHDWGGKAYDAIRALEEKK